MERPVLSDRPVGFVSFRDSWKNDLLASVVVFLVALPLCMGIAIASGVPTEKAAAVGIITGIVGGLVVGLLGGSPLQVSGPAAGLSVIVFELVQAHGWEMIGVIVLLAGVVQLAAGLLRLGQWFRAVSPAVIHGMLAGIGILIFASQFHVMVDDQPRGSGIANLLSIPEAVWKALPLNGPTPHQWAALTGLVTISIMMLWNTLARGKARVLPAPLVAVVLATAVAASLSLPIRRVTLPENLLAAVQLPTPDLLRRALDWAIVLASLSLAFVASAETLLCATAVDQMHRGPRTRYDRELAAQGLGNLLCGLLGALPMTGVIVRSATNVQAGARTQASAFLHGVWLLLFVSALPFVLETIPTATLAAVLVFTGYKLVDREAIRKLWGYGKSEFLIYAATVAGIVLTDLLTGVLVGVGLSAAKLLYTFSHLAVRVEDDPAGKRTALRLEGTATFLSLPRLAAALETVPYDRELHVQFDRLHYIDHACLELLMSWEQQYRATGGSLTIDWKSLEARFRQPPHHPSQPNLEQARVPGRDNQPAPQRN
jgi:MFS superfamily sulfate permease-like transporter